MLCFSFCLKHDPAGHEVGEVVYGIKVTRFERVLGDYSVKPGDQPARLVVSTESSPTMENDMVIEASARKLDDHTVVLEVPEMHERRALLLVSSANPNGIVPLNDKKGGSFFRHAPIRRSEKVQRPLLKGLARQKINGHEFEVEEILQIMRIGDSITVKPAGSHSDEGRIITWHRTGFTVRRVGDRSATPKMPTGLTTLMGHDDVFVG